MNQISLVATDLDGTLLYDREHISERDLVTIRRLRENHMHFIFATGRQLDGVLPLLKQHALQEAAPEYIIHSGGAGLYHVPTQKDDILSELSVATLHDLYDRCKDLDISILMSVGKMFYTNKLTDILRHEALLLWREIAEIQDFKSILTEPNPKFILNGTDEQIEKVLPIVTADTDPRYCFFRSHDNYIDCYPIGISKGYALKRLCEQLDVPLAQTLAIGDNLNDIQLLETAGFSACPGDGHPFLFDKVDYVACSAKDGAVTDACTHFLWQNTSETPNILHKKS